MSGLTPAEQAALARAPRRPEQQWWNVPAKLDRAGEIAQEELDRSRRASEAAGLGRPHNNRFDAARHAEWSRRMSTEIDPLTSFLVGTGHEGQNLIEFQPIGEIVMDLRNNAEGRRAAAERRAVNPSNLQIRPNGPLDARRPYR